MKSASLLLTAALLPVLVCFSVEEFRPEGNRGNWSRRQRGQQSNSRMMQNQVFVEAEIAKACPEEFAELEKLREQYEAKLAELAKKAGVTLPESRDASMRKLRRNHPEEFLKVVELMKKSPREGFAALSELAKKDGIDLFGGFRRGNRGENAGRPTAPDNVRRAAPDIVALRRKYPEKMREYDSLRVKDYKKAREILIQIIKMDESAKK